MDRKKMKAWYKSNLGQKLLEIERAELESILPNLFGYHLLQIGAFVEKDLLSTSRISHRVVIDGLLPEKNYNPGGDAYLGISGRPDVLPIQSDCVDVVLLHHTLEFENDPHQALREVDRVLVPEGHVVIQGINPWSYWGLWRLFRYRRGTPPWFGRFRSLLRIKDWLGLLGFDTVVSRVYFYRPPFQRSGVLNRLRFLDALGKRWWPFFGGAYLIVAKKRESTLTMIKPRWRPRRLVDVNIPKPTTFQKKEDGRNLY